MTLYGRHWQTINTLLICLEFLFRLANTNLKHQHFEGPWRTIPKVSRCISSWPLKVLCVKSPRQQQPFALDIPGSLTKYPVHPSAIHRLRMPWNMACLATSADYGGLLTFDKGLPCLKGNKGPTKTIILYKVQYRSSLLPFCLPQAYVMRCKSIWMGPKP